MPPGTSRCCESVAGLLGLAGRVLSGPAAALADVLNSRTARHYGRVVCPTDWAAAEFERLGVANVLRVPLGVDLDLFSSDRRSVSLRDRFAAPDEVLIVHCGRLSVAQLRSRVVLAPGPVPSPPAARAPADVELSGVVS